MILSADTPSSRAARCRRCRSSRVKLSVPSIPATSRLRSCEPSNAATRGGSCQPATRRSSAARDPYYCSRARRHSGAGAGWASVVDRTTQGSWSCAMSPATRSVSASRTASRFCCCQPLSDHNFSNKTGAYWGSGVFVIGSGGRRSIQPCRSRPVAPRPRCSPGLPAGPPAASAPASHSANAASRCSIRATSPCSGTPSHRAALRRQEGARRAALLPQAGLPAAGATPTGTPARPEEL